MSRAGILAFAAASVAGSGCGGVATTGTPGSGHTGGVSGAGGLVGLGGLMSTGGQAGGGGAMDTGGAVPAVFYGAPFPVPMTGGSGGMGSGGDSGSLRDGGSLCFNAFYQRREPCCPEATPDCTGKPDGYPGFACTPNPGSFCSCTCEQGGWICGC